MFKESKCYECTSDLNGTNWIGFYSKLFHKGELYIITTYNNGLIVAHTDNDKTYLMAKEELTKHFKQL